MWTKRHVCLSSSTTSDKCFSSLKGGGERGGRGRGEGGRKRGGGRGGGGGRRGGEGR